MNRTVAPSSVTVKFALPLLLAALLSGCETTGTSPPGGKSQAAPQLASTSSGGTTPEPAAPAPAYLPAPMANGERRFAREFREETTPDGRRIRVAYDTEIDAEGHPLGPAKPAKW